MSSFVYKNESLENYDSYETSAANRLTLEEANRIFTEYYNTLDFTDEFFPTNQS